MTYRHTQKMNDGVVQYPEMDVYAPKHYELICYERDLQPLLLAGLGKYWGIAVSSAFSRLMLIPRRNDVAPELLSKVDVYLMLDSLAFRKVHRHPEFGGGESTFDILPEGVTLKARELIDQYFIEQESR